MIKKPVQWFKKNKTKKRLVPVYRRQRFDFREDATWRMFRIMSEFVEGFQFLGDLRRSVTFFGSARLLSDDPDYKLAEEIAYKLGKKKFTVISGGGPGIMEAANKGAARAKAESIGLNIQLPVEQRANPYISRGMGFHYFFTRKVMLSAASQAYLYFPGGFGTLDEFFEMVTLIQTKKMEAIPVILVGKHYWKPLINFLEQELYAEHRMINHEDLSIFTMVDTADEAVSIVEKSKERRYF